MLSVVYVYMFDIFYSTNI